MNQNILYKGWRIKWSSLFFFCILFLSSFPFSNSVLAVSISPLRQTISIDPGTQETVKIEVTNDTQEEKIFIPSLDAFSTNGGSNEIHFGKNDEALAWVDSTQKEYTFAPGEKKEIPFTIIIPNDAQPGAHYLGLLVSERSGRGQIGAQGRVGSLLFLYVSGRIEENVSLDSFTTNKKLYFGGTVFINAQLKNNGTIHIIPVGNVQAKKKDCVDYFEELNTEKKKIFPHTSWQWEKEFPLKNCGMGLYRVTLYVQYGLSKQTMIQSLSFYYFPPAFVIISFVGITVLIILSFIFYKKRKGKK